MISGVALGLDQLHISPHLCVVLMGVGGNDGASPVQTHRANAGRVLGMKAGILVHVPGSTGAALFYCLTEFYSPAWASLLVPKGHLLLAYKV